MKKNVIKTKNLIPKLDLTNKTVDEVFPTGNLYKHDIMLRATNIHQQDLMFLEKGDDIFPEELLLSLYDGGE